MLIFRDVTAGNLKIPPKKEKEKKSTNYQFLGVPSISASFRGSENFEGFPRFFFVQEVWVGNIITPGFWGEM